MFTAEVAAAQFRVQALTVSAVTAAVVDRIVNLQVIPQDFALPALLHYAEAVAYAGPINADSIEAQIRYVFRFVCNGESTQSIAAAAEALRLHMNGYTGAQDGFWLTWLATGEWPITTVAEGGDLFRQLGVYYKVDVTPGA